MTEPCTFASLEPLLLARKGAARPASGTNLTRGEAPEVKRQQHELVTRIADSNEAEAQRQAQNLEQGRSSRRAAFTLRLDEDRHLKLKLASAVCDVSSQQLVTQALDRFLAEMPEIEMLAAQVRRAGKTA